MIDLSLKKIQKKPIIKFSKPKPKQYLLLNHVLITLPVEKIMSFSKPQFVEGFILSIFNF